MPIPDLVGNLLSGNVPNSLWHAILFWCILFSWSVVSKSIPFSALQMAIYIFKIRKSVSFFSSEDSRIQVPSLFLMGLHREDGFMPSWNLFVMKGLTEKVTILFSGVRRHFIQLRVSKLINKNSLLHFKWLSLMMLALLIPPFLSVAGSGFPDQLFQICSH